MTMRFYFNEQAGPWVAYREVDFLKEGEHRTRRDYAYRDNVWHTWNGKAEEGLRFDTKAEAMAFIKGWCPRRVRGQRLGAERVEPGPAWRKPSPQKK